MTNQPVLGQGLNALIPPQKNHDSSDLEEKINQKVNESISHFPQELKEQFSLHNLRKDFQKDLQDNNQSNIAFVDKKVDTGKIQNNETEEQPILKTEDKIFQIETDKIKSNPYQPRHNFSEESIEELAESIREFGILEPLLVTRLEKETEHGTEVEYQLLAGERRLMAAKKLGLPTVPVIIKTPLEEKRKLELALIENIQREDLDLISKARAFERLIQEFGLTQQELAQRLGKSREVIANSLRLLQLPLEIQKALEEGVINEGHARALLLFTNPEKRRTFFKEILAKNLSGREAWELAQRYLQLEGKPNRPRQNLAADPQTLEWKEKLEEYFAAPVVIKKKGEKGAIEIKFFSERELETILEKLFPS